MLILLLWLSTIRVNTDIDYRAKYLEYYIQNKPIEYRLGGIGPRYYDCGGIVTEAYRKIGYRGYKINSHFWLMDTSCKIPLSQSSPGDILINSNEGKGHVALITKNLGSQVEILDYVNTHRYSSYRKHGSYPGVVALKKDCLLNQKYWIELK